MFCLRLLSSLFVSVRYVCMLACFLLAYNKFSLIPTTERSLSNSYDYFHQMIGFPMGHIKRVCSWESPHSNVSNSSSKKDHF